jgi:hypothetical protein
MLERQACVPHKGAATGKRPNRPMPTLTRYVIVLGIFAALVYGAMYALATLVVPKRGEMTVEVPLEQLKRDTAP